jgi:Delta7-sterol 5-desaturase
MQTLHLLLALLLAVINYSVVYLVGRWIASHNVKRVYAPVAEQAQLAREQRNAIVITPVHALIFIALIASGALQPATESWFVGIVTFLIIFLWTEIWHYFSHRAMHHRRLLFMHREHHLSAITNPWTSISFSFMEKFVFSLGIIGFMAITSHWMPISVVAIAAYYVFYFVTNTLGHANVDFRAPGYRHTFMGKCFVSPSYHAMHHARYIKNYGLITPWLDNIFGTAWEDYDAVQTQVARGKPLSRLGERLVN